MPSWRYIPSLIMDQYVSLFIAYISLSRSLSSPPSTELWEKKNICQLTYIGFIQTLSTMLNLIYLSLSLVCLFCTLCFDDITVPRPPAIRITQSQENRINHNHTHIRTINRSHPLSVWSRNGSERIPYESIYWEATVELMRSYARGIEIGTTRWDEEDVMAKSSVLVL